MGCLEEQPLPVVNLHKEGQERPEGESRAAQGTPNSAERTGGGERAQKECFDRNEIGLPGDRGRLDRILFAPSSNHEHSSFGNFWVSGANGHRYKVKTV